MSQRAARLIYNPGGLIGVSNAIFAYRKLTSINTTEATFLSALPSDNMLRQRIASATRRSHVFEKRLSSQDVHRNVVKYIVSMPFVYSYCLSRLHRSYNRPTLSIAASTHQLSQRSHFDSIMSHLHHEATGEWNEGFCAGVCGAESFATCVHLLLRCRSYQF
jgi:hypothetical protein